MRFYIAFNEYSKKDNVKALPLILLAYSAILYGNMFFFPNWQFNAEVAMFDCWYGNCGAVNRPRIYTYFVNQIPLILCNDKQHTAAKYI